MIVVDIIIVSLLVLTVVAGVLIVLDKVPERLAPLAKAPGRAWKWLVALVVARIAWARLSRSSDATEAVLEFQERSDNVLRIERDAEDGVRDADAVLADELQRIEERRRRRQDEARRARSGSDAELMARFDAETDEAVR